MSQRPYANFSNLDGEKLTSWQQKSREKKAATQAKSQAKMQERPQWNDNVLADENPHKLSHAEVLQRKLNAKSKNEAAARMEYQMKLDRLKKGRVPEEYKEITDKGRK